MRYLRSIPLSIVATGLLILTSCKKEEVQIAPSACYNLSTCASNLLVQFFSCSENATTFLWDFGDGTKLSMENPVHFYHKKGEYKVTLIVTSIDGLSDSYSKYLIVSKYPKQMIVDSIKIVKWPETNRGVAWDSNGYPDIFPVIFTDTDTLWTSTQHEVNCVQGTTYSFYNSTGLPITLLEADEGVTFGIYDYDTDSTSHDYMGGFRIYPSGHVTEANKIILTNSRREFEIYVQWVY